MRRRCKARTLRVQCQPRHAPRIQGIIVCTLELHGALPRTPTGYSLLTPIFPPLVVRVFFALILAIQPATAQAQTDNWINAGTGSWFTPGNWSLDAVPTAAINAAVDTGGKALVTGANATVGNLTIGDSGWFRQPVLQSGCYRSDDQRGIIDETRVRELAYRCGDKRSGIDKRPGRRTDGQRFS